jgi:hypothetical protein
LKRGEIIGLTPSHSRIQVLATTFGFGAIPSSNKTWCQYYNNGPYKFCNGVTVGIVVSDAKRAKGYWTDSRIKAAMKSIRK